MAIRVFLRPILLTVAATSGVLIVTSAVPPQATAPPPGQVRARRAVAGDRDKQAAVGLDMPAGAATRPRAHYVNGQVWVVWEVDTNNVPDTYAIYASPVLFTNTAQATLEGRLFAGEWSAAVLKREMHAAYGSTPLTGFRIPVAEGSTYTVKASEGVFARTVRATDALYYAVVPFGQTAVPEGFRTAEAVAATFSASEPPQPYLQSRAASTTGHVVSFFAIWVDGDQEDRAARPDFPLMANAAKRGVAHTCMIVEPRGGLPGAGPWPATVCLHGGNGGAIEWLPSNEGARSINIVPSEGMVIAFDDDLYRVLGQAREASSVTTGHLGYAREHDPFTPGPLPLGSTIVNYTQRRNIWLLDWLVANAKVDAHRISLLGHSNGAQGAMMLARVFPTRFSAVLLFNCTMRLYDGPAFESIYGTATDNFATAVLNSSGMPVRMLELTRFAEHISPERDLPFFRSYAGKCDNNNDRQWGTVVLDQMLWSDEQATGLHFYWDLRSHGFDKWTDYWVDATSTATLLLQTQRDDVRQQARYRNDQAYPAFFNARHYPNHGDPGPGFLGGSTASSPCGLARDPGGNLVANGDDHGTWGGYFDWETNIVDTATNWACALFLVGPVDLSGLAGVDESPHQSLTVDVAVRRPQHFKPAAGATVYWRWAEGVGSENPLQSGVSAVRPDGLVTVSNLTVFKDPRRARLELQIAPFSESPSAPGLTMTTNELGRRQVTWHGHSGFSSQLEHGRNLIDWFKLDLPAQERDAIMSLEIPTYLLEGGYRFFRLARQSLVTTPVPAAPGFYTSMSFVHAGIGRRYFLKIPDGWSEAEQWPLVLALPGHGQSIAEFAVNQAELIRLADSTGFIIVFAEATAGTESYLWFASDNPNLTQPYIDDAAFLFALVEHLKGSRLRIDPGRVYASGFSNGGSMVHYLAGRPNHPFAAFAIIESGTAGFNHYKEPYNRDDLESGTGAPASVPMPWQARPVLLMNMATSVPWTFEGRGDSNVFPLRGARHNVARWTQANGYGSVAQVAPEPPLPPPALIKTNITWTATGVDRSAVAYEDVRPDHNWPEELIAGGWSRENALRFPYVTRVGTEWLDYRLPAWVRLEYPHQVSADPASPARLVRVDLGTMTVEIWRSALNNRSNEVIFVGLSDGGHQWPNSNDKLPFNANVEVLKFFSAH